MCNNASPFTMKPLSLDEEIKKQKKDPWNWLFQINNFLSAVFSGVVFWFVFTLLLTASYFLFIIFYQDWVPYSFEGFRQILGFSLFIFSIPPALIATAFYIPLKMKSVFYENAKKKVDQFDAFRKQTLRASMITDEVLEHYNLVSREAVNDRAGRMIDERLSIFPEMPSGAPNSDASRDLGDPIDPFKAASGCRGYVEMAFSLDHDHDYCNKDHLLNMVKEIESGHMSTGKANRWLGYIQGVLVRSGDATVDQMREVNTESGKE